MGCHFKAEKEPLMHQIKSSNWLHLKVPLLMCCITCSKSFSMMMNILSYAVVIIHTLRVHYMHAAGNLNWRYSKYGKAARVHYYVLNRKMSWLSHLKKNKKQNRFAYGLVWIRLITAYLVFAQELWHNNALALQFRCLSNALTLQVRALDVSKSQHTCIVLSQFTGKSKYAVTNL